MQATRATLLAGILLLASIQVAAFSLAPLPVPATATATGGASYPAPESAPSVASLNYGASYVPRYPAVHAGLDRDDGIPYGVHLSFAEDPRTTLTVTWFTAGQTPVDPALQWGSSIATLTNTVPAATHAAYDGAGDPDDNFPLVDVSVHTATIHGLTAGQRIAYRVVGDSGVSFVYEAHTAPLAGMPVKATLYGDHGVQAASKETTGYVLSSLPDLIVILGDISYANGNQAVWDQYFDLNEPLYARVPVMPSSGNHEADDGPYFDAFRTRFTLPGRELFYGFDYGNLHFTIIEANGDALIEEPTSLLADVTADLMSANLRRSLGEIDFTFAVQHFPLYSNNVNRNFDEGAGTHTHADSPELVAVEEPIFEAVQVDALLTGHNHQFERSRPILFGQATTDEEFHYQDPIGYVQLISGGGGQSLYDFAPQEEFADWSVAHAKAFHVTELTARSGVAEFRSIVTSACPASFQNCLPGAQRGDVLDHWSIERPTATASATTPAPGADHEGPVRFILTGDTGEGNAAQYRVSGVIDDVCAERGCDFMAILGDLIYEAGVASPYDSQFDTKFEAPYANLDMPIYTVLGNHDNSWDPVITMFGEGQGIGHWYDSGRHMVGYHYRTDKASDKWQMPDRYYNFRYGDAEFFALDSNTMMWNGVPTGATDPTAVIHAAHQGPWLQGQLQQSDAPWKFTLAHHPYVSNGEHGDAGHYDDEEIPGLGEHSAPGVQGDGVKLFFDQYVCTGDVAMHFAGHDHDLQWLKPVPTCGDTEFIVSGAGAKSRQLEEDPAEDAFFGRGATQGFFWVEVDGPRLKGIVYDEFGNLLYERTLVKPGLNQAPAAAITGPTKVQVDTDAFFDATGSRDADGTIASYAWEFGDGSTGSGATVAHAYTATGTYMVTLTVTDDIGATGTTTHLIEVTPDPRTFDPGFAFEDVDGDCLYLEGTDVVLASSDVLDGRHTAAAGRGLVIPASLGPLKVAGGVEYAASGGCLALAMDVQSSQPLVLNSNGGPLIIRSSVAGPQVTLASDGGSIDIERASLAATSQHVRLLSSGGPINAAGSRIAAQGQIDVDAVAGAVDLAEAVVRSHGHSIQVKAASLACRDCVLWADRSLTVTTTGTVDLRQAELRAETGKIVLDKTTDANILTIAGAEIAEPGHNGKADVRPSHTQGVVGTPATGGLE